MKKIKICFAVLIFLSFNLQAAKLQSIKITEQGGKLSLLFNLNSAISHRVFTLTNPDRIVIDLNDTELAVNLNELHLNKRLIKCVRSGYPKPKQLRLVFEVNDAVMFHSKPAIDNHAFSLDITPTHTISSASQKAIKPIKKITKPVREQATETSSVVKRSPVQPSYKKTLRDVVVVIDAGHGGKDPGAKGPRQTWEKNVTLAIATKLKQIIDGQPGMHAVLTRTGDYYVGLRERLNIARKYNGDVFVSIHADAFINQESNGASVFALSQRGATSEAARWLAEKENYSELGGVNLADLDDQSGLVRTVLIDLSQTATIGASLHMGENVLRNLNTITRLHNHKVEQARFMVLKSPDIPSILIETGFISNPREESNLTNSMYQNKLTQAVFQGIKGYFWDYPPHGTWVEAMVNNSLHFVKAGETLPKIAAKYHISVASLQTSNHLANEKLKPGQRLFIPRA